MGVTDGLAPADVRRVHAAGTRLTVPAGWSLIWERTPADKAYLVVSGEVSVRRGGEEVARLGAGDMVGESAIVRHRLRSATVVAATRLEVVHFTSEAVTTLCAQVPAFGEALDRVAQERLPA
jgi:CRP/FNR family cyclic AMP-dependent transcriptional regulator